VNAEFNLTIAVLSGSQAADPNAAPFVTRRAFAPAFIP